MNTISFPNVPFIVLVPNNFDADFRLQVPINLVNFRYPKLSRKVCHPENIQSHELDIVIVVKSAVINLKRRNQFRQFYENELKLNERINGSERFGLIFAIGLPRYHISSSDQNPLEKLNPGEFRDYRSYMEAMRDLVEEMKTHDDLLVGDFEDSYRNLSKKMHFYYTWAATFCRLNRPTFLFVDDDMPFSLRNLVTAIHYLSGSQRACLLHGAVFKTNRVRRPVDGSLDKWSIAKTEVPWPVYTPHFSGYYIIVGFDQIEKLALAMLFTKPFSVDDAWLGLVAARMGLRLNPIEEILSRDHMLHAVKKFLQLH